MTPLREAGVRKHPAPEGALRRFELTPDASLTYVRKHPAPEGALRRHLTLPVSFPGPRQKAPSTRRCIKTSELSEFIDTHCCQKAPSTRRCIKTQRRTLMPSCGNPVRKHPAPEGALRRPCRLQSEPSGSGQKAASTTKCIKTLTPRPPGSSAARSERTQHHKVH